MYIPLFGYVDVLTGLIALVIFLSVLSWWTNRGRVNIIKNLHLTVYDIDTSKPNEVVRVYGQTAGLVASILARFGFGNFYTIRVTSRFVVIQNNNKTDEQTISLAITSLDGVAYSYGRQRIFLWIGIALILFGLSPLVFGRGYYGYSGIGILELLIAAIGAAIIYFVYWKRQLIEVRVTFGDGGWYGYNFFTTGEGTVEKARETALIIQKLIHTNVAQPSADPVL